MGDQLWEKVFGLCDDLRRSLALSDQGVQVVGFQLKAILFSIGCFKQAEVVDFLLENGSNEQGSSSDKLLKEIERQLVFIYSRRSKRQNHLESNESLEDQDELPQKIGA